MDTKDNNPDYISIATLKKASHAIEATGDLSDEELTTLFTQITTEEAALSTLFQYYKVHTFTLGYEVFESLINVILEESSPNLAGLIILFRTIMNKDLVLAIFQGKISEIMERYPQKAAKDIMLMLSSFLHNHEVSVSYEALEFIIDSIIELEQVSEYPSCIIDLYIQMINKDLIEQLLGGKFASILEKYPQAAVIEIVDAIILRNENAAIYFQQNGFLDQIPEIVRNGTSEQKRFIFEQFKAYHILWRARHRKEEKIKMGSSEVTPDYQICSSVCDGVLRVFREAINAMFEVENVTFFKFYLEDIYTISQFPEFALTFLQHPQFAEKFSDPDFTRAVAVPFFDFLHAAFDRYDENIWWEANANFPTDITANAFRDNKWMPIFEIVVQFIEDDELRFESISAIKSLTFEASFAHHTIETGVIDNIIDATSEEYRFSDRTKAVECMCEIFSIADKEDAYELIQKGVMDICERNIEAMCQTIMDSFMNVFTWITRLAEVEGCDDLLPLIFDNDSIIEFLHKANDGEFDSGNFWVNEGIPPSDLASNILARDPMGTDDHFI